MANLANLEFTALDITGNNYLSWILDAEIHLDAKGLGMAILPENNVSRQDKAKAMIFLRHHLHEELKTEYLTVKDPLELWTNLKDRYDHQKTVILPRARYEWIHLRLQDFKTVSEYNSAVFKISSQLRLCGENITDEDLLEKTFSTFHATNILLQQQYRGKGFKKYSELISCLLVAEQNNELLMKNHENRPTGFAPFPEVNVSVYNNRGRGRGYGRGRGRGRNRGRGRGNYRYSGDRRNYYIPYAHKKNDNNEEQKNDMDGPSKVIVNRCYRCGMKGHWAHTCRTSEHLVKLYQASMEKSVNNVEYIENNEAHKNDNVSDVNKLGDSDAITHLEVDDFYD